MAQTSTTSIDDAKKKFKKIKSFRKEMSASIDAQGQTFTMEMIEQFKSPSFYKSETIAMGMTVQSEVINSKVEVHKTCRQVKLTLRLMNDLLS